MCYRSSKLDVPSTLAANLRCRDFDTATLTDDTLVSDTLVFATSTFIVLARSEYLLTEESSTFRALCTIVDGLRDEYFTI